MTSKAVDLRVTVKHFSIGKYGMGMVNKVKKDKQKGIQVVISMVTFKNKMNEL